MTSGLRPRLRPAAPNLTRGGAYPCQTSLERSWTFMKLVFLPRALLRLREIQAYIAYDNETAAATVVSQIRQSAKMLAGHPHACAGFGWTHTGTYRLRPALLHPLQQHPRSYSDSRSTRGKCTYYKGRAARLPMQQALCLTHVEIRHTFENVRRRDIRLSGSALGNMYGMPDANSLEGRSLSVFLFQRRR